MHTSFSANTKCSVYITCCLYFVSIIIMHGFPNLFLDISPYMAYFCGDGPTVRIVSSNQCLLMQLITDKTSSRAGFHAMLKSRKCLVIRYCGAYKSTQSKANSNIFHSDWFCSILCSNLNLAPN